MRLPIMSKRKADAIANGVFLILLGIIFFMNAWWPGILLAIGSMFAVRQFLTGRKFDLLITLSILGVIMLVMAAGITFSILIPLLFIAGGIYLILREYFFRESVRTYNRNTDIKNNDRKNFR